MNDDELKSIIDNAGSDMPPSTKASIAAAVSAGFRADGPAPQESSDERSVVVALGPGAGEPRRAAGRWIAVGGAVALAAALIGVFVLRNDHDQAQVTDTVPVETTTPTSQVPSATTVPGATAETEPTDSTTATTETATTETATTETGTTDTATTARPTTETTDVGVVETATTSGEITADAPLGLPDGLALSSLSFPTMADGWVVGSSSTDSTEYQLLHTTDGGVTWTIATPEPIDTTQSFQVAFADPDNGWIVGANASVVYSTHDGGGTWSPVGLHFDSASEDPLYVAAGGGFVHVVTFETPADPELAGRGPAFRLFSAPADGDQFTESAVLFEPGAGPVFDAAFTFATNPDGSAAGWFVYNDRGYQASARLVAGQWVDWTAPCAGGGGTARLASSPDAATLVVACSPYGFSDTPPADEMYVSTDGGFTFTGTASLPGAPGPKQPSTSTLGFIAAPSAGVILAGYGTAEGTFEVVRSTDSGTSWSPVDFPAGSAYGTLTTIPESPLSLLITSLNAPEASILSVDGGVTWAPVNQVAVNAAGTTGG